MDRSPRNLLFTGGWDSTFRLLQLLLVEKRSVQPIYILDPQRWSLSQELKAMARIRRAVRERSPESRSLLRPIRMYDRTDIREEPEIREAEEAINSHTHIGPQYEWLARAVKQFSIKDAELGLEYHENPVGGVAVIRSIVTQCEDGISRFPEDHANTPEYALFGRFSYPLIRLTKTDMMNIARDQGFLDILEMSWFCHRPTLWGDPCGTCNPCKDAMTKGMQHRVGLTGRIRYRARTALDPRPWLRQYPSVYDRLKRAKLFFGANR